jgi:transcription-repair coupling factor (superfamily II helicase)
VRLISEHQATMRVRPDQKVVIARNWPTPELRLRGVQTTLAQLVRIADLKAA